MDKLSESKYEGMVCTPDGCVIAEHKNKVQLYKDSKIKIKMYSDFICPWCLLSYRILEDLSDNFDIEIEHVGCELIPDTPSEGEDINKRFGKLNKAIEKVNGFDKYSLNLNEVKILPNTRKALLLEEYIKNNFADKAHDYSIALWNAYLKEGINIGDNGELVKILNSLELDISLDKVLNDVALNKSFMKTQEIIKQEGKNMIPYFVINDSYEKQGYVSAEKWSSLFNEILKTN